MLHIAAHGDGWSQVTAQKGALSAARGNLGAVAPARSPGPPGETLPATPPWAAFRKGYQCFLGSASFPDAFVQAYHLPELAAHNGAAQLSGK